MGYFILAAILSTLFFAIILFVEPIGERLLRRIGEPLQERIGITILRILFGLIALVVPFGFLWLISGIVHPPTSLTATVSTIVFSPQSRSALLGVVFGALFLVWIARLYATQASPKPKGPQKHGEPAASAEAGQGLPRLLVVEGYFLLALFIAGSLDVLNPILQRISGLKLFGAELSLTNPGPAESPNAQPLATGPAGDSDRVPARAGTALNFLSAIDALMRRDNVLGPLARRPMSPAPPAAIKLAHDAIAPLAACHAALYSVTRSPRFMVQAFAGLDAPVHALALAADYRVDEADRAALTKEVAGAYAEAATRAIEGAYTDNISLFRKARARGGDPEAGGASVEVDPAIRENCSDLLAFACLKTGAQPYCADDIVPRDGPSRAAIRKAFADAFSDLVDEALAQDEDADRRPYFAIVAASVSSLLGQPQAAVAELDRWTTLHATAPVTWNNLRPMSTLASFTEDWLRSSRQASQTQALQEFYLDTLARLIAEFRDIPAIDAAYLAFRRKTKGVPTLDFDVAPIDSAHCSLGARPATPTIRSWSRPTPPIRSSLICRAMSTGRSTGPIS